MPNVRTKEPPRLQALLLPISLLECETVFFS